MSAPIDHILNMRLHKEKRTSLIALAATLLLLASVLFISVLLAPVAPQKRTALQPAERYTLNYIKPFTSLVVFNARFRREKTKDKQTQSLMGPFMHLETLFTK